ncbi:MAG: hypothetical protein GX601_19190 [Anaerolineales bacterium]|nr:hypothetical protein [Anaerolineales bacterium]
MDQWQPSQQYNSGNSYNNATVSGADLLSLVQRNTRLRRVASTNGGEWVGACPLAGCTSDDDAFHVWPDHPSGHANWWCRACNRGGDTIAYLVAIGELSEREAAERRRQEASRDGRSPYQHAQMRGVRVERPLEPATDSTPPSAEWQARAAAFVDYAESALWQAAGAPGRELLARRGIADETAMAWRLGWNSAELRDDPHRWGLEGDAVWLARGLVVPCLVRGAPWYVKVRRGSSDYVYVKGRGPSGALYGLDLLSGRPAAVICEGELDAVLLWQETGDLVDVVAIGAKASRPALSFLAHLAGASLWLLALDCDAEAEAGRWGTFSDRIRRMRPLVGNDVTDYAQQGGNLRAWVSYYLAIGDGSTTQPGGSDIERQAEALLSEDWRAAPTAWAQAWAALAERAGWPCYGFASWAAWAEDVAGASTTQLGLWRS